METCVFSCWCFSMHVYHKHVLGLQQFLLLAAFLSLSKKALLVGMYVVVLKWLQFGVRVISGEQHLLCH